MCECVSTCVYVCAGVCVHMLCGMGECMCICQQCILGPNICVIPIS